MLKYVDPQCNRFVDNMEGAGFAVEHYRGRNFWQGPAVSVDGTAELQQVIRATDVNLQWDTLGKTAYIVYPTALGGEPIEE